MKFLSSNLKTIRRFQHEKTDRGDAVGRRTKSTVDDESLWHRLFSYELSQLPECSNYFEGLNPEEKCVYEIRIRRLDFSRPAKTAKPSLKAACFAALLFCLTIPQAFSSETVLLTPEECVVSALANHPSVQLSQLDVMQAQAKKSGAFGRMLPELSTSFYGALSTDETIMAFDVRATQPLFLGGELMAKKKKAEDGLKISQHRQSLTKAEIAYAARRLFYEIKKTEAEVKLAEEELIHARKQKDAAEALVEKENEPAAALFEKAAQVSQKEKDLLERKQELENLYAQLLSVAGLNPEASYVLADVEANQAGEWLDITNANADLKKVLALQVHAANQDIKIARANRFPKAYLVSRYRREDESFYEKNALEAGVLVKWNIWDFGVTSSEIRVQKAELAKQELFRQEELRKHEAELRQLRSMLKAKEKVIEIARRESTASEEQFKNAKAKLINGDISALAMDEIRVRHLKAQANVVLAFCDYEITKAFLLKVLGITGVDQ